MPAQSPFLPGTHIQYAWDSTSLGWLKECPRKYYYSMIEGWRSRGEAIHLKYGQLYHSGLELHDKLMAEGKSYEDALAEVVHWLLKATWENDKPWETDHNTKTRETLVRSVIWYLEHFKEDNAKTIILANGRPAVELSFRMELEIGPYSAAKLDLDNNGNEREEYSQPYILCGHIDRLAEFLGGTYVLDRKTTGSALTSNYFDQYTPDNQMSLYTVASRIIYQTQVRGIIIDAAQIMVGFTRFGRGFASRTEAQCEEWLNDAKHWFRKAEEYATQNYWPMNDKSCHHYGGCPFRKICSKSPEVRETFLQNDFVKHPWNPLESR